MLTAHIRSTAMTGKPAGSGEKPSEKEPKQNDKIVADQVAAEKRQREVPSPGEPSGGE
jgi:hypothetical protein